MPMVAPPMWRESKSAESPGNPGRFTGRLVTESVLNQF